MRTYQNFGYCNEIDQFHWAKIRQGRPNCLGPGEKLHEELYWQGEGIVPTENKKIIMLKPNGLYPDRLYAQLKKLEESSHLNNIQGIYALLKEIVPEAKIGNGV